MQVETTSPLIDPGIALIPQEELRKLQQRSDARGLGRLAGHLAAVGFCGFAYALSLQNPAGALRMALATLAATALGFTLVTMFAAMHESVHRTAFKSLWLNNAVAWFAGLLSFYNSTFYRHYHGFHHRFTQIPGKDPELGDKKPESLFEYAVELSGVTWWIGKLKTHFSLALGRVAAHPYLNEKNTREVVRSVRLQLPRTRWPSPRPLCSAIRTSRCTGSCRWRWVSRSCASSCSRSTRAAGKTTTRCRTRVRPTRRGRYAF